MADRVVLAVDVGGTNTRARVVSCAGKGVAGPAGDDRSARISTAHALLSFIARAAAEAVRLGPIAGATVAVAGPVVGRSSRLTNWPSDNTVTVADLEGAGLPAGRTVLVNDMAAGAWGALERLERGAAVRLRAAEPAAPEGEAGIEQGNLVYLAPGTGLGAAALVSCGPESHGKVAVSCESQHTQIPRFPGEIAAVAEVLEAALGHPPRWEDVVSGRGLVRIYEALDVDAPAPFERVSGADADRARAIAAAARTGVDTRAARAVDVFYEVLGYFAQLLALTFGPCAAVVIGGASTEHNLELIRRGPLVSTFDRHARYGDLLRAIPIHTVGGDVNLVGGIRLAACQ